VIAEDEIIGSLPICDCRVTHACVTFDIDGEYGAGVYSWHGSEADAEHNARITGGRAVPVDRMDGEVIVPSLARMVLDRSMEFGSEGGGL
jgi:hypothetical protein